MAPRYFARRRLSPYLGCLQVVDVGNGRATSDDGLYWTLQLRSGEPVGESVWGSLRRSDSAHRWFVYGRFHENKGLWRAPLSPVLGDVERHESLAPLLKALKTHPKLPFALLDHQELWLLDREGLPLALLASELEGESREEPFRREWSPMPIGQSDFTLPESPSCSAARERLRDLVDRAAGSSRSYRWFDRLDVVDSLPELTIREEWSEDEAMPMRHYLEWMSPLLLLLPGLTKDQREWMESAAVNRPMLLHRFHRLIPEYVDRDRIRVALVEATLRLRA